MVEDGPDVDLLGAELVYGGLQLCLGEEGLVAQVDIARQDERKLSVGKVGARR